MHKHPQHRLHPTVYRLAAAGASGAASRAQENLEPVKIRTGLSDGRRTEVIEGLHEGDRIVVGIRTAEPAGGFFARIPELLAGNERPAKHDRRP